ncbi:MAG: LLM class flavin-dependent oxidoreductase [Anaerolineae bacterium]|nr:LLM class flavin-dependent oxidoreductase [Anaerolineae bacterium]
MSKREVSIAFQTDKSASEYVEIAQLVDNYGFDAVTVYCDAPYHPSFGPLLLMAQHIKRSRIGAAAIPPSRIHPIDIAAETALLADVAQAGIYIGFARGGWLEAHGISEAQLPIQAIREAIDIVRYLWSGKSGGYQGRVYQIAEHVTAPYPLPQENIPILIGTWGKKLAAVAGEIADEVKIGGSANPDVIPAMADYIAVGEKIAGREKGSVGIVIGAVSVVDEDRQAARWEVKRQVALYLPIVAKLDPTIQLDPELVARIENFSNQKDADAAARLISDDILDKFAFAGNPDDLINHANRLFEAGATRIEFGTPHGLNPKTGIRLLGEKVLPVLQRQWQ